MQRYIFCRIKYQGKSLFIRETDPDAVFFFFFTPILALRDSVSTDKSMIFTRTQIHIKFAREYVEAEHNKSPLHQSMTGGDLSLMCYLVKVLTC